MFCFAITGGIGSGKSYLVRLMEAFGIPAYIADIRAKELYKTDSLLLRRLIRLLGKDIIHNGELRRDVMAAKIFSNQKLLSKVNDIVHPAVLRDFINWRSAKEKEGYGAIIFESAIFLESPLFHFIADKVIVVCAPEDVRIKRVIKRDNMPEELVRERIARQWSDERRKLMADFIIFADGKKAIMPQIIEVFNKSGIKPVLK
ncbi:MAG: dephospho-CoA kinase [Bacteroidetes bacterium HGW-Bacteroidetes-10]|jgi:dephospho-CoA kinase|nr:MAG: dephospho-CoA kinase [Bacteroidetes bacterium HGW-Bacteroidetes-10]